MNRKDAQTTKWQADALKAFERSLSVPLDPDDVGGKNGRSFAQGLPHVDLDCLPIGRVKRSEVFSLASNPDVGTATVSAAVMAWGGMHVNFRDLLFKSSDMRWLDITNRYREGLIDRRTAYAEFRNVRDQGHLKGAGPAYFTKLIYFLTPRGLGVTAHGYIMDQWAGCSINLLSGREVVLMDVTRTWHVGRRGREVSSAFRVSDVNTEDNYEEFCSAVDALATEFNRTADQIDRALLADGGRTPSDWRRYIVNYRTG